jgi:hypothetical protein
MNTCFTIADLPIFIVPIAVHLSDITFTVVGSFTEILWIVLLANVVQIALLAFAWLYSRLAAPPGSPTTVSAKSQDWLPFPGSKA